MKRRQKFIKFKDLNAWDDIEEMQSASRHTATWERLPTPVFLPGESQAEPSGLPSVGSHRVGHD